MVSPDTDAAARVHDAPPSVDPPAGSFERVVAWSLLPLFLATWRLFLLQTDYPSVGVLSLSPAAALTLSRVATGVLIVLATALPFLGRRRRVGWTVVAVLVAVLAATDTHRLQPWLYLAGVLAALFATAGASRLTAHRVVLVSLYLYSGLGKLDYQFVHTVGREFLDVATFGVADRWPDPARVAAALAMPTLETVGGLLLIHRRTRPVGRWFITALHLSLIALLGPWSLGHSAGVLVWNAVMIGYIQTLFRDDPPRIEDHPPIRLAAKLITLVVVLAPLTERLGYWDHWSSWQLYAPHTSRTDIDVLETAATRLPESIRNHLGPPGPLGYRRLDAAAWSLAARGVPVYPQARYQRRLGGTLAERYDLAGAVRMTERSAADRLTGRRD